MQFWLQHDADRPLAIRAVADPLEDFEVVPEYWDQNARRWIVDEDLADEMFWNPSIRRASQDEVENLIQVPAAA